MESANTEPKYVRDLFEDEFINKYIHAFFNLSEDSIKKSFKENRIQLIKDIAKKQRQIDGMDIVINIPDFGNEKITIKNFYEKLFEYEFHTILIKQFELKTKNKNLSEQIFKTVFNKYFDKTIKIIKYEKEEGLIFENYNITNGQIIYLVFIDILNELNQILSTNKRPSREPKNYEKRNSFFVKQYSSISEILKKLKGQKNFQKLEKEEKISFLINYFDLDYFDDADLIEFIIDMDKIIINESGMIKTMGGKVAIIENPNNILLKNIDEMNIDFKDLIINKTPNQQVKLYICNKYNLPISKEAIKKKLSRGMQKIKFHENIIYEIDLKIKFLQDAINTIYKYAEKDMDKRLETISLLLKNL